MGGRTPILPCSGWGLPCGRRLRLPGALLPHPFTLPRPEPGDLLSVALSLRSPSPAVSRHPALRSPDFPPDLAVERPSLLLGRRRILVPNAAGCKPEKIFRSVSSTEAARKRKRRRTRKRRRRETNLELCGTEQSVILTGRPLGWARQSAFFNVTNRYLLKPTFLVGLLPPAWPAEYIT